MVSVTLRWRCEHLVGLPQADQIRNEMAFLFTSFAESINERLKLQTQVRISGHRLLAVLKFGRNPTSATGKSFFEDATAVAGAEPSLKQPIAAQLPFAKAGGQCHGLIWTSLRTALFTGC